MGSRKADQLLNRSRQKLHPVIDKLDQPPGGKLERLDLIQKLLRLCLAVDQIVITRAVRLHLTLKLFIVAVVGHDHLKPAVLRLVLINTVQYRKYPLDHTIRGNHQ